MKYKIKEVSFKDHQQNIITQRYIKTKAGFLHLPIKIGEITQFRDIVSEKNIGYIELELPIEHIIIENKEVEYQ
jgi:hypothetical protein